MKDELRLAIAKSIKVPFGSKDTVVLHQIIYNDFVGSNMDIYYFPGLMREPYFTVLKSNYDGTMLCSGDSLFALIQKQRPAEPYSRWEPEWFYTNKIKFTIEGEVATNKSVRIYESYKYGKAEKSIKKLFTFDNGQWTYKIDTSFAEFSILSGWQKTDTIPVGN